MGLCNRGYREDKEQAKGFVMTIRQCLVLIVAVVALSSCGDGDEDDNGPAGVPNPAAVFCEEQGGTVEIVTDTQGNQSGI